MTASSGRKERVQVPNCCDIFKVEAVILYIVALNSMTLSPQHMKGDPFCVKLKHDKIPQICHCVLIDSEVVNGIFSALFLMEA